MNLQIQHLNSHSRAAYNAECDQIYYPLAAASRWTKTPLPLLYILCANFMDVGGYDESIKDICINLSCYTLALSVKTSYTQSLHGVCVVTPRSRANWMSSYH